MWKEKQESIVTFANTETTVSREGSEGREVTT
jgi:hypothetical protein